MSPMTSGKETRVVTSVATSITATSPCLSHDTARDDLIVPTKTMRRRNEFAGACDD